MSQKRTTIRPAAAGKSFTLVKRVCMLMLPILAIHCMVSAAPDQSGLIIKPNGFVGIGIDNPLERLHIGSDRGVTFHNGGHKALSWNAYYNGGWRYLNNDFAAQIYTNYGEDRWAFKVAPSGSENAAIDWVTGFAIKANGNIGFGTANPKEKVQFGIHKGLTIHWVGDKALSWNAYFDGTWKYLASDCAYQITSNYGADKLHFQAAGAGQADGVIDWVTGLTFKTNGYIGVGTNDPLERLQIGSDKGAAFHDGGDKALSWNAYYDGAWKYMDNDFASQLYMDYINDKFYIQMAPVGQANGLISWEKLLTVQADGKIGIGTANPKAPIQIGGSKGVTIHSETESALSWNAYYDNGWKYLGDDFAYQLYADGDTSKFTIRTAASGLTDNAVTWTDGVSVHANGSVSIGTTDAYGYKLAVAGDVIAETLVVKPQSEWPDFVFKEGHQLQTIEELENYINKNGCLPGITTANEVAKAGVDVGEMQVRLLQKIEELTLYVIQLKKDNEDLKKRLSQVETVYPQ